MAQTMGEEDLILNLKAAGFEENLLRQFLGCWKAGKRQEQMQLLSQKREGLLDQVHREEKQIQCLDYLVYRMEKENKGETGV